MSGLRQQAAADLAAILEDDSDGFGWPVTVTDPDGTSAELKGFTNDVFQSIEQETGLPVVGRNASVALRISALTAEGLGVPVGIPDTDSRPWRVAFDDINGNARTFKVSQAQPDYTLGLVLCQLTEYET